MTKITFDISVSVDGYVAGPNPTLEQPLGEEGERLHDWALRLASWRESHGVEGGESDADDELLRETMSRAGAIVMGRRMFSGGTGPWEGDPNANGWWGDEPPFRAPVFVVTRHAREPLELGSTTFTFVTGGVEAAIERARGAADGSDVAIGGGASVIQQALRAGVVDDFQLHIAPVLLGGGVRLFENVPQLDVERVDVLGSPTGVAHLRYRVRR